jgi:hypothetical protein
MEHKIPSPLSWKPTIATWFEQVYILVANFSNETFQYNKTWLYCIPLNIFSVSDLFPFNMGIPR